ncbi:MAG: LPS assembly protein LptD, partial [Polynucleobacter victoriensis]
MTAEAISDAVYRKDRWAFGLKHTQTVRPGLVAYTDYSRVSDDRYVDDLGKSLNGVVNRQFNQEVGARYAIDGWNVLTRVQKFQTLQPDPANPVLLPYEREPQINARFTKNNWNGLNFSFESDVTRFTYKGLFDVSNPLYTGRTFKEGNRAYAVTSVAKPF